VINFKFEIITSYDMTGFSLGHVSLSGELGMCSSKGHEPPQAMMIFVAICDLLDGVRGLVDSKGKVKTFNFVGADSSFSLSFRGLGNGNILVSCPGKGKISEAGREQLCASLFRGVMEFIRSNPGLPDADPVKSDLQSALEDFSRLLSS
jgi:hypothetical protein